MIIVGAKGFAKELLEVCKTLNLLDNIAFFDDYNLDSPKLLYNKYPILKSIEEARQYILNVDKFYSIGIGKPNLRKIIYDKFNSINAELISIISPNTNIGSFDIQIGEGANILDGVKISNSVSIGIGALIYYNSIITHDCKIGNFVEISPNVTLLGRVQIGDYSHIGASSTILPDIIIGSNVIIGAGSVVTKHIPNNSIVAGVPAKLIRFH